MTAINGEGANKEGKTGTETTKLNKLLKICIKFVKNHNEFSPKKY